MSSPNNKILKPKSRLANNAMIAASLVIVLAGMQAAKGILAPIFMAAFLAVILVPPFRFLCSKGFSKTTSMTVVILSVLIVGVTLTSLITTQLNQFSKNLPDYSRRFSDVLMNYNLDLSDFFPFFEKKEGPQPEPGSETPPSAPAPSSSVRPLPSFPSAPERGENLRPVSFVEIPEAAVDLKPPVKEISSVPSPSPSETAVNSETSAAEGDESAFSLFSSSGNKLSEGGFYDSSQTGAENEELPPPPETWSKAPERAMKVSSQQLFIFLKGFVSELTLLASNAFFVLLLLIFMLLEAAALPEKMAVALAKRKNFTNERLKKVAEDIRRYMMIKTLVSILVGTLVALMLTMMKVQYPILWGVIAFFLNFIPNIGSTVAAIPPIILAIVDLGVFDGMIVTIFMILINCFIGYALEPKLMGDGLDLSPLVVLLSLFICGWLLGPVGMFLSPPLAVIAKIILQSFPETRWIAILMANGVPDETPPPEKLTEDKTA